MSAGEDNVIPFRRRDVPTCQGIDISEITDAALERRWASFAVIGTCHDCGAIHMLGPVGLSARELRGWAQNMLKAADIIDDRYGGNAPPADTDTIWF